MGSSPPYFLFHPVMLVLFKGSLACAACGVVPPTCLPDPGWILQWVRLPGHFGAPTDPSQTRSQRGRGRIAAPVPVESRSVLPGPGPETAGFEETAPGHGSTSTARSVQRRWRFPSMRRHCGNRLPQALPHQKILPSGSGRTCSLDARPLHPAGFDPGCRFPSLFETGNSSIFHRCLLVPGSVPVRHG